MRDFNHTIDVLVKAYMNDTLVHGNCYACAVGNMIADSTGTKVVKVQTEYFCTELKWDNGAEYPAYNGKLNKGWGSVFTTEIDIDEEEDNVRTISQKIDLKSYHDIAKIQIDSTGYSVNELARIEYAFESVRMMQCNNDQYMIKGLMAVVDVLADIHGIDLEVREETKKLFVKA